MFTTAVFTTAKHGSNLNAIDRGMHKEDMVHIRGGIYLTIKKNEIMPFAANRLSS